MSSVQTSAAGPGLSSCRNLTRPNCNHTWVRSFLTAESWQSWAAGGWASEGASKRVSAETCAALSEALSIILDRAPSTVIAKITEILTSHAGKYGDFKK